MERLSVLSVIGSALGSLLTGLLLWACSEVPLAWREIAINTRSHANKGSEYSGLQDLSVLIKVFAIIAWVAGVVIVWILIDQDPN